MPGSSLTLRSRSRLEISPHSGLETDGGFATLGRAVRPLSLPGSSTSETEEHSPRLAAKVSRAEQELSILETPLPITHQWASFAT